MEENFEQELLPVEKPKKKNETKIDYYHNSNVFSKLFFVWAGKILRIGRKSKITSEVLGELNEENDSKNFSKLISYYWEEKEYKKIKENALMKTVLRVNCWRIIWIVILFLLSSGTEYFSVILTKQFIDYFTKKEDPSVNPLLNLTLQQTSALYIAAQIVDILSAVHAEMIKNVFSSRAGFELSCFIYQKILSVSPSSFDEKATHGEMVNLIQIDSVKLQSMILRAPNSAVSFLQICAYILLLFNFFGISFLVGFFVMIFFVYSNVKMYSGYSKILKKELKAKDDRMEITTETLENLKFFKMYGWEGKFQKDILNSRETETDLSNKSFNLWTRNISFFWLCPVCVSISTIGVYLYFNEKIEIGALLIGLAIFAKLQIPVRGLPNGLNSITEALVSMRRIEKFLRQPERDNNLIIKNNLSENAIKIEKGNFTWGRAQDNKEKKNQCEETLKDISITIKKGDFVGIIGEVGSGKSSFLQAILNNLILLNPKECKGIEVNGKIGYVSQIPWVQNDTIKNNVLFFSEYDEEKYSKVLELSQLKDDIENFDGKDQTEIGDKGLNLSKGQKVRVALARALYKNSDIYLLDDLLSSVDANIGKAIMNDCIVNHLKGKTILFVTNSLNYLKHMNKIIYLQKGRISWEGNFDSLLKQSFFEKLKSLSNISSNKEGDETNHKVEEKNKEISKAPRKVKKLYKEEFNETGGVKFGVYIQYFKYLGGITFSLCIILVMLLWQINKGGSDLWLAFWSKKENQEKVKDEKKQWIFFGIYSSLSLGGALFIFFRLSLITCGIIRLAKKLHKDMIVALIKAPINTFHETIPKGEMYNRLSKDLEAVQFTFFTAGNTLVSCFNSFGSLIICSIFDISSLMFFPFFLTVGFCLAKFYLIGSRQLTRLQASSRSPILNIVGETVPGSDSIIAFGAKENYLKKFYGATNNSYKISIFNQGVSLWLTERFKFLSAFYILYLAVIISKFEDRYTPQSIGIMLTYSVFLQRYLGNFFVHCAEMENAMISMERCVEYTKIPGEAKSKEENDKYLTKKNWPQNGKIRFENFSVKYRPNTEIVLKNISFEIAPKEKVGIVGRTGSGKSTILLCLFRILEPLIGKIFIDDVDIFTVGLDLLRRSITIIPQDPCLMKGTLKYNVDPLGKSKDQEILATLKNIGYSDISDDEILNKNIEENGNNLSAGQKQLICIARAMLRNTKIIVMDEATANIDLETESKIQDIFTHKLKDSTIITIAHRIKTVLNYDRVLVLHKGQIAEFDSPNTLLKNQSSIFYQLWQASKS